MIIINAAPADAPALIELHRTLADEHPFVPTDLVDDDKRSCWMSYYIETQNDWQQIYLAKQGATLVGNLWAMRERTSSGQQTAHLGLAILQSYCRQGIGTRLLSQAETWAKSQNCRKVSLSVVVENLPAVLFFLKQGYRFEALKKESYCDANAVYDEYVMSKFLT